MFSYIQNINSASEPRKAEAVDSRLSNKNKNNRYNQKNQRDEEKNHTDTNCDTRKQGHFNRFSIKALIYFLEDVLEKQLSSIPEEEFSVCATWSRTKHDNSNIPAHRSFSVFPSRPAKPQNKIAPNYAAHIYAHQAEANSIRATGTNQPIHKQIEKEQELSTDLPEEENLYNDHIKQELSELYTLICNLRTFKKTGITHLDIMHGVSITEGVRLALKTHYDTVEPK
ncbi:MAG: hypothetical protein KAJ40_04490 [Alphaproteobacteria bacterium]|nr:hypothetical protein [Alphaproteobacteria bacterium]